MKFETMEKQKELSWGTTLLYILYPDLRYETTGHDAPVVECAGAGPGHLIWTVTVSGAPGLLIRAVVVISPHHGHPLASLLSPHDHRGTVAWGRTNKPSRQFSF